jgi:predicted transcriptional regulator
MRRTTISLPDDLAEALDREARRRSVPVSAVARDALADHLGFGTAEDHRELPFAAVGRSGKRTTARNMEKLIEQEWDTRARRR